MKIDRHALASAIRNLEGLDDEKKSQLLSLVNEQKRYGLVWEDHPEEMEDQLRSQLPVFTEVPERRIVSEDPDAPNHILIEGDNLHALTSLCYTHEGKVDVIYIDPPYNTGNKDFIYNDSFVDTEDGYRHSKWLSFMSRRLRIAKRLLSDRGVIFISIDDNEQANLKLLCDEVFGEINGIGPIIQNKLNAKNDAVNIQRNHEYILCYRKQVNLEGTRVLPHIIVRKETEKEVFEESGEYYYLNDSITTRGDGGTLNSRPNLGYTFYYNPSTNDIIPRIDYNVELAKTSNEIKEIYSDDIELCGKGYIPVRPPQVRGKLGCWTWDINKAQNDIQFLLIKGTKNRYNVVKRTFVPKEFVVKRSGKYFYTQNEDSNSRSILDFSTNDGSKVLTSILGDDVRFNNPKNLEMINYLIQISSSLNSTILDFFAGSGTTLHATMQLNAEDGGHRQCIMVTNNENGICENVTYERNKRVIKGYTTPKGVEVAGLKNNNLRYYKTDFVSREKTASNRKKLMALSTDLLCIKENLYAEKPYTLAGKSIRKDLVRYFEEADNRMLIIYDQRVVSYLVEEMKVNPCKTPMKVYVYSDGQYAYNDEFVGLNVELCALPDAIYQALNRVLPKEKDIALC